MMPGLGGADIEPETYVERSGAKRNPPEEGSVEAELMMMAQVLDEIANKRSLLREEIGAFRDRITPILDLTSASETNPIPVYPDFGTVTRCEVATEVRRLTALAMGNVEALDREIVELQYLRARIAL